MHTPPYQDSPERLELISKRQPEMLQPWQWQKLEEWQEMHRGRIITMTQNPTPDTRAA